MIWYETRYKLEICVSWEKCALHEEIEISFKKMTHLGIFGVYDTENVRSRPKRLEE